MKKILHIIDHPGIGGAQRIVEDIVNCEDNNWVIALRYREKAVRQMNVPAEKYILTPARSLRWLIFSFIRIPFIVHKKKIEIVHCHLFLSWLCGLWLSLCFVTQPYPKIVFHEHDSVRLEKWFYRYLLMLARRVGKIIAVSDYIKNKITSISGEGEDVVVIKNGVDLNRFNPDPIEQVGALNLPVTLQEETRFVGFASRLVKYKGWEYIFNLAERLKDEHVHFLIAGDGPDRSALEKMIEEQNLKSCVHLLGYVNHMDLFYHHLDALIVTTQKEAFGLVQLEAQASGVPVIVFDTQASRELQGDHSLIIVPNGDIACMADYVRKIIHNQQFAERMILHGLSNAREYSLDNYIKRLDAFYESMGK